MENQNTPHVEQQRQKSDFLKKEMCLLLNWTEMEFGQFQYQCGIAYLMWYLPCDDYGRDQLERSRTYWGWYKLQWEMNDLALIEDSEFHDYSTKVRIEFFRELHNPRIMAVEVKPNSVVLSELKIKAVL